MNSITSTSFVALQNGFEMPLFGLGTWLSKHDEASKAVTQAIDYGYRLIDTAQMYENEVEVGRAIADAVKSNKITRKDLFVVTKLLPSDHGKGIAFKSLQASLERLGLEYIDLVLIHSPSTGKILDTWSDLIAFRNSNFTRSIGVSNFGVEHLKELEKSGFERPQVNQIELHCWLQQKECVKYCKDNGIVVMGYCPLARTKPFGQVPELARIAEKYAKNEAQIALRWSIQSGIVTIPKSTNESRIKENFDILENFSLNADEMNSIAELADIGFKASQSVNSMDLPWEPLK